MGSFAHALLLLVTWFQHVRVSIGFPRRSFGHPIGQCWSVDASADGHSEIFISPELGTAEQTSRILGVLAPEVVHATVGTAAGHKAPLNGVRWRLLTRRTTAHLLYEGVPHVWRCLDQRPKFMNVSKGNALWCAARCGRCAPVRRGSHCRNTRHPYRTSLLRPGAVFSDCATSWHSSTLLNGRTSCGSRSEFMWKSHKVTIVFICVRASQTYWPTHSYTEPSQPPMLTGAGQGCAVHAAHFAGSSPCRGLLQWPKHRLMAILHHLIGGSVWMAT